MDGVVKSTVAFRWETRLTERTSFSFKILFLSNYVYDFGLFAGRVQGAAGPFSIPGKYVTNLDTIFDDVNVFPPNECFFLNVIEFSPDTSIV